MAEAVEWKDKDLITAEKLNQMQQVQGPKGDKGDTGATGKQGPAGTAGKDGAKGETGAQGPAGKDGTQGPKGIGVKSLSLKADASGKITGGTLTTTDDKTSSVTVTQEAEKPAE